MRPIRLLPLLLLISLLVLEAIAPAAHARVRGNGFPLSMAYSYPYGITAV